MEQLEATRTQNKTLTKVLRYKNDSFSISNRKFVQVFRLIYQQMLSRIPFGRNSLNIKNSTIVWQIQIRKTRKYFKSSTRGYV